MPVSEQDLHPTVAACVMRSFCDATFDAAQRRADELVRMNKALDEMAHFARGFVGEPAVNAIYAKHDVGPLAR